jgi:ATP-binding cassette subfamily B protein
MMERLPTTLPKFLWHFTKGHRGYLFGFILVAIVWAINVSLNPYALKLIIDAISDSTLSSDSLVEAVKGPALFYIVIITLYSFVFRIYDWLTTKTYPQIKIEITQKMFKHILEHSYSFFQHNFSGSLSNKINDMSKNAVLVISDLIDHVFSRALCLIIGATTMYLVHPYFAILLITWTILFITISLILSKKAEYYSEIFSQSRSTVIGKIVDGISNILNIKLFARQKHENDYLNCYLNDSAKKDYQGLWYLLKIKIFYSISIILLVIGMVWLLIYERSKEHISIGDFALILTLNMFLIEEVKLFADQLVPFSEQVGICKQALSIITPKHEIVDLPNATQLKITQGEIVFDKVHFKYKKGQDIFNNKSITIHPGQKVGLVGFSGSGKSTFVNLILRFFDINSGQIFIDGQDIKTVTQESLRSQIAMIPQDPILFHRTLIENIRYGRLNATEEEIVECSKKAHCHEFIEKLHEKYEAMLGERGVKLSGGQRQRIAIARAILKNAPILILDEATSALDSLTENYIQESLSLLMEGRTCIVIAHRLSTLFYMDRILVFHEGQIIEDGTHDELLTLEGHYAKLWSMQAGGFLEDE